jgi:hypothetical protein
MPAAPTPAAGQSNRLLLLDCCTGVDELLV